MKKAFGAFVLFFICNYSFAAISSSHDGDLSICPMQTDQVIFTVAESANPEFGGNGTPRSWSLSLSNTADFEITNILVAYDDVNGSGENDYKSGEEPTVSGLNIIFKMDAPTQAGDPLKDVLDRIIITVSVKRLTGTTFAGNPTITLTHTGGTTVANIQTTDPTLTVTPPTNHCAGEDPNIAFTHTAPCTNLNNPVFSLIKRSTISQAWNIGSVTDGNMGDGEYTYANFVADADAINTLYILSPFIEIFHLPPRLFWRSLKRQKQR